MTVTLAAFERNSFLVLGRAGMDLYADPPGAELEHATRFTAALGGSAGNIAVGLARLGAKASLISAVSDDGVGRYTLNQLNAYGVGTSHVANIKSEVRTSLAVVETRAEDCQSVIYRNNAADFALTETQVAMVPFASFGVLIVTGTALAAEPSRSAAFLAMTQAKLAGADVVIDLDYRPYSWVSADDAAATLYWAMGLCDMTIGNDVEFGVVANGRDGKVWAQDFARNSGSYVIYKMGEKGCLSFVGDQAFETPIFKVDALKPTGAGDAFCAGLATGLAKGMGLSAAVCRGAAAAAIVVTRVGCAPAMPTEIELIEFMKDRDAYSPV
jgi:5-dehydro-2-deoxygluconokinase